MKKSKDLGNPTGAFTAHYRKRNKDDIGADIMGNVVDVYKDINEYTVVMLPYDYRQYSKKKYRGIKYTNSSYTEEQLAFLNSTI